jgi:flagellar motor switch protein FliN
VVDEAMPEFEAEVSDPGAGVSEPEPVAEEPMAEASPDPISEIPDPPLDLPIEEPEVPDVPDPAEDLAEHLLGVDVRFWAELGRAELPLAEAVSLGTGAIVDLDREPSEPVDVYVNGTRFATARLLVIDGEWAIRLEEIIATPTAVEQLSSSGSGA